MEYGIPEHARQKPLYRRDRERQKLLGVINRVKGLKPLTEHQAALKGLALVYMKANLERAVEDPELFLKTEQLVLWG